ncbi:MAG TPA: hypothetical protein VLK85_05650 [Ramlibacter sp.]|nr:hypothetical protein [Ramlibacter sp.]
MSAGLTERNINVNWVRPRMIDTSDTRLIHRIGRGLTRRVNMAEATIPWFGESDGSIVEPATELGLAQE